MATTIVSCPKCQVKMKVDSQNLGKKLRCPKCSETFRASGGGDLQAAPPPQQQSQGSSQPAAGASIKTWTKKPVVLGVAGVVVLVIVLVAVFSGGDTDPRTASDDEIIEAYHGSGSLDFYHREMDADPLGYERVVDGMRKSIIRSGLTCEEYGKRRMQNAMVEKKMGDWSKSVGAEFEAKEGKLKGEIDANSKAKKDSLRREWVDREREADSINIYENGLSKEEFGKRKKLHDEARAKADAAGKKYSDFTSDPELEQKLQKLKDEHQAAWKAYRESIMKEPVPTD